MMAVKVNDLNDSIFLSCYREMGDQVMGISAEELKTIKESEDNDRINETFNAPLFKKYTMTVKAKYESYTDEGRMRYYAQKMYPHSLRKENDMLLRRLAAFEDMPDLDSMVDY